MAARVGPGQGAVGLSCRKARFRLFFPLPPFLGLTWVALASCFECWRGHLGPVAWGVAEGGETSSAVQVLWGGPGNQADKSEEQEKTKFNSVHHTSARRNAGTRDQGRRERGAVSGYSSVCGASTGGSGEGGHGGKPGEGTPSCRRAESRAVPDGFGSVWSHRNLSHHAPFLLWETVEHVRNVPGSTQVGSH